MARRIFANVLEELSLRRREAARPTPRTNYVWSACTNERFFRSRSAGAVALAACSTRYPRKSAEPKNAECAGRKASPSLRTVVSRPGGPCGLCRCYGGWTSDGPDSRAREPGRVRKCRDFLDYKNRLRRDGRAPPEQAGGGNGWGCCEARGPATGLYAPYARVWLVQRAGRTPGMACGGLSCPRRPN